MNPHVVTVTGWRDWPWAMRRIIWTDLLAIRASLPGEQLMVVRHGACRRGVDMIADRFAVQDPQCVAEPWPAQWNTHGPECGTPVPGPAFCPGPPEPLCKRAGDRRNRAMAAAVPRADQALAYPGPPGRSGTRNAVRHLREAGVPVLVREFADIKERVERASTSGEGGN